MAGVSNKGRRRGPRGDISANDLAAAASRVLETAGLDGLSLRAVAAEAGVTPNAVYTYFVDMSELRNRVGDAFLACLDLTLLEVDDPVAALAGFLRHVLDSFADAPGHVALLASQRIIGEHSLALNEALLDFFVERLEHDLARAAVSTGILTEWVHGVAALAASDAATDRTLERLATFDPSRYPRTAAAFSLPSAEDVAIELLVATLVGPPAVEDT